MSNKSKKSNMLNSASPHGLSQKTIKEKLGLVALEPRILLDAAGFVTGAEVAMDALISDDTQTGVEAIFNPNSQQIETSEDPLLSALAESENVAAVPEGVSAENQSKDITPATSNSSNNAPLSMGNDPVPTGLAPSIDLDVQDDPNTGPGTPGITPLVFSDPVIENDGGPLNFTTLIGDLDANNSGGAERVIIDPAQFDAYILEGGASDLNGDGNDGTDITAVQTVTADGTFLTFAPTDSDPSAAITDTGNAVQLVFSNTSSFTVRLERDNAGRNIGLNGSISGIFGQPVIEDTNANYSNVFIEGSAPISIAAQSADVDDLAGNDITSLQIEPGNIVDGSAEIIAFNGDNGTSVSLSLDGSDTTQQGLTIGGTAVFIQFDAVTGVINVTAQDGGVIPQDDLDALIRAVTYENTSNTPTDGEGTDRTLTFRVTNLLGDVSNDAVSTIQVVDVPLDTDGDGVADEVDVDDDNDGILDVDEGVETQGAGAYSFTHNEDNGRSTAGAHNPFNPGSEAVVDSGSDVTVGSGLTVLNNDGTPTTNGQTGKDFEFYLDGANSAIISPISPSPLKSRQMALPRQVK